MYVVLSLLFYQEIIESYKINYTFVQKSETLIFIFCDEIFIDQW